MWNIRNTFMPFLLLLAMGCTAEDPAVATLPDTPDTTGAQPVCFSLNESSALPVASRATQSPLPAGETVRVLVYRAGSTNANDLVGENTYLADPNQNRLTPCQVDANGMVTGLGEEMFLTPGKNYDIHAYSPALPSADRRTVTGIGHGMDLLGSKLTLTLNKFTPTVELTPLVHQCAMMEFTIQADPTDPSAIELSAESVTLKNMSRAPGSYTLGSSTGVSPNNNICDAAVTIEAFNKVTDTQITASQVVLPKAESAFSLELKVFINGAAYTLTAPVPNLALQTNKKYTWVVNCQREGITLSFTVADWQPSPFDSNAGTPALLQEPANSFMVPPGRAISFAAKRADGTDLTGVTSAEVLWQTRDGMNPVIERPAHVMWDNQSGRIRVYTNTKATNGGKAVVVARSASSAELYRWLIWITPYNLTDALNGELKEADKAIVTGVLPAGAAVHTYDTNFLLANGGQTVMMDRNLGATATTDAGCTYQHGSPVAWYSQETLYAANGVTVYTPPTTPSTVPATTWTPIVITGTGGIVASGTKSGNDPCPYGWRVPANNGTAVSTWGAFSTSTFTTSTGGRTYAVNGAYYPTSCWGANRTGDNGYALQFNTSSVSPLDNQVASGLLSVRCVQDAVLFAVGTPKMEAVTLSSLTATSATFNCRMTSTGGATIVERGFYYDTQSFADGAGSTSVKALEAVTTLPFSAGVPRLTQGTTYYVQAYIRTSVATFYSPLVQFVPSGQPKVSTDNATSATPTTATVTGNVTDTGGDAAVKRGVVYSTTSNFDPQSQGTQIAATTTGSGSYSIDLTGLQAGTAYFVRAYATNAIATTYGMQRNFNTVGPPTFSDAIPSNLTGTTVTFRSGLTGPMPTPGVTEWGFEWSVDANFPADVTTIGAVAGPYTTGKTIALDATGLADNTVYYVRTYGVNVAGKGYSSPVRFVTMKLPVVATLLPVAAGYIGTDNRVPVTFNGEVTDMGSNYPTDRGFEYSTASTFAPGTGTRVSAGSGGSTVGKFAAPTNVFQSDCIYYIRAYAINAAGTGYGDIRQASLDYVEPTFDGVSLRIIERRVNTLRSQMTGAAPQPGNAKVIVEGYAYQEKGSSDYIYSWNTPRLKVYKEYTVYACIMNAKGMYYSKAKATGSTYSNYVIYNGEAYVADKPSGEGYEAWATGIGSLVLRGNNRQDGGYYQTKGLAESDNWSFHPNAAKFCWNKSTKNGQRWFLPMQPLLLTMLQQEIDYPYIYDPALKGNRDTKYWSAEEDESMTAWAVYYDGQRWDYAFKGKNDHSSVRCMRRRVLPADEYAD